MDAAEIETTLADVYDEAIVFHAFTDYMRDYEIIIHRVVGQPTDAPPHNDRFLFKCCVDVRVTTARPPGVWRRSLDPRLLEFPARHELDGFAWGVRWENVESVACVIEQSQVAARWTSEVGIDFHEVRFETNVHEFALVFHDLEVTPVAPGYAPFVIDG